MPRRRCFRPPPGYVFPGGGDKLQLRSNRFPRTRWFEYHCWESEESADAELWHHTHQRCVVLRRLMPGEADYEMYEVRFADGFVAEVCADELVCRRSSFFRPDYQPRPKAGPAGTERRNL